MDSEPIKRKKRVVTFEYYEDRHEEFVGYFCFIQKHLSKGNPIPNRVLKKIGNILNEVTPEQDFGNTLIINEVFNRFNDKNYYFSYTHKKQNIYSEGISYSLGSLGDIPYEELMGKDAPPPPPIIEKRKKYSYTTINLKDLITHAVNDTYKEYAFKLNLEKDDCIIAVYTCIEKYCKDHLNKKNAIFLTTYKKQVLAGFITTQYGWHLTDTRKTTKSTNNRLFQATRNAIKKRDKNLS